MPDPAVGSEGTTAPVEGGGATQDTPTSTPTGPESTPGSAPSPEERDAATFARHGLAPDGTPLKKEEPKPEAKPEGTKEAAPDDPDEAAKDPDADDGDDVEVEITDEQFDAVVDAALELNADRIAANPKLRGRIEAEIRAELEAKYEKDRAAATANQQREQLIRLGKTAAEAVLTQIKTAQAELVKAQAGEDFDPKAVDPAKLGEQLSNFGAAAVADTRRSYDDAFASGFKAATTIGGDLTTEERDAIVAIVNTANRTEADAAQGEGRFDAAKNHLYGEMFKFLTTRAFEAGKKQAIADAKAKRTANKTVLDADAVLAGAAKEARARGKLPPNPTAPGAPEVGASGPATMEAYQAAKRDGKYDLADAIMAKMQSTRPATTRQ